MHKGKLGNWKKAWFVLDGAYLFQYDKQSSKMPKKAYYVSYSMSDKVAAEALASEAKAQHMTKLEEKACSLRLTVWTPDKVKIFTAPSEDTLGEWVTALEASVQASCADEAVMARKKEASEQIQPLMMKQVRPQTRSRPKTTCHALTPPTLPHAFDCAGF